MLARHITPLVEEALLDTPVVLINGARQTGKSTLVQALAQQQGRRYLTLDDQATLAAASHDPAGFIAGIDGEIALDEVQRAPGLFLAIKAEVDRNRKPGRFLLTGSANVLMLPEIADSLAGRMEVLTLWPLSTAERAGKPACNIAERLFDGDLTTLKLAHQERRDFIEQLVTGGFPEMIERRSPRRRESWFDNYIQAILYRDVRDLARIEQLTEIPNLLELLANRSGSLLNLAELARATGLSQTTLKRYFTLLETLFLVYRLSAWARNPGKRLVKSPKIFLPDSGLLTHLLGLSEEGLAQGLGLPGNLVETWVLGELLKHLAFSSTHLRPWHYRTQGNIEVDIVLENRAGKLIGIEVKSSHNVAPRDFKGLKHLQDTEPERFQRGIVLYTGPEVLAFGKGLWAVPVSVFSCR
ncbi:MAG TPA: ATP-binding protein [Gammaproteobacteria bacterium]|nr:ATP-binding protein [Gammaproteobacteria bacterium]